MRRYNISEADKKRIADGIAEAAKRGKDVLVTLTNGRIVKITVTIVKIGSKIFDLIAPLYVTLELVAHSDQIENPGGALIVGGGALLELVDVVGQPLWEIYFLLGGIYDTPEAKKIIEKMKLDEENAKRLKECIEKQTDGCYLKGVDGKIFYVSEKKMKEIRAYYLRQVAKDLQELNMYLKEEQTYPQEWKRGVLEWWNAQGRSLRLEMERKKVACREKIKEAVEGGKLLPGYCLSFFGLGEIEDMVHTELRRYLEKDNPEMLKKYLEFLENEERRRVEQAQQVPNHNRFGSPGF